MNKTVSAWLEGRSSNAELLPTIDEWIDSTIAQLWLSPVAKDISGRILVVAAGQSKQLLRRAVIDGPSGLRAAAGGFMGHGSRADDCEGFSMFVVATVVQRVIQGVDDPVSIGLVPFLTASIRKPVRRNLGDPDQDLFDSAIDRTQESQKFAVRLAPVARLGLNAAIAFFTTAAHLRSIDEIRRAQRQERLEPDRQAALTALDDKLSSRWIDSVCEYAARPLFPLGLHRVRQFANDRVGPGALLLILGGLCPHAIASGPWCSVRNRVIPAFVDAMKALLGPNFMVALESGLRRGMTEVDLRSYMRQFAAGLVGVLESFEPEVRCDDDLLDDVMHRLNADADGAAIPKGPLLLVRAIGRGAAQCFAGGKSRATEGPSPPRLGSADVIAEFKHLVRRVVGGHEVSFDEVGTATAQVCDSVRTIDQWTDLLKR
ncbi:MAG: hypothetical protein IT432_14930 [Phycisphaerales bacterium]|nr:hypothetical protein [Phycisphaerales bacterium]